MKKIISMLLCLCMVMTSVCIVFADDPPASGVISTTEGGHGSWTGETVTNPDGSYTITGNAANPKHLRYNPTGCVSQFGLSPFEISYQFTLDTYDQTGHNYEPYFELRYRDTDGEGNIGTTELIKALRFSTALKQGETYTLNVAITKDKKISASLNGTTVTDDLSAITTKSSVPGTGITAITLAVGEKPKTDGFKDVVTFQKPQGRVYSDDYTYAIDGKLYNATLKLISTYDAKITKRGNVTVSSKDEYPITIKSDSSDATQYSFNLSAKSKFPQYTEGGASPVRWLRLSSDVVSKSNYIIRGEIATNNATGTRYKVFDNFIPGETYKMDMFYDLSTGKGYIYCDGSLVSDGVDLVFDSSGNTNAATFFLMFYTQKSVPVGGDMAVLKNAKYSEYSNSQTLDEFKTEMAEYKNTFAKGVRTIRTKITSRGGCTVEPDGADGYEITTNPSAGGQTSSRISLTETVPYYTGETMQEKNVRFLRLHGNIQFSNFNGMKFDFTTALGETKQDQNASTVFIADTKKHSYDIIYDMMTKQRMTYIDGVIRDSFTIKTSADGINGMIIFSDFQKEGVSNTFKLSDNYAELYYDYNPVIGTFDELAEIVETGTGPIINGAYRRLESGKCQLYAGFVGFKRKEHIAIAAEYDAEGNFFRATRIESDLTIIPDNTAASIKVFLWNGSDLRPLSEITDVVLVD